MSDVFVARQPILDERLDLRAYELLFRGGNAPTAEVADADGATSTVVINAFTEIGLDRMVGLVRGWINASASFITSGLAESLPADRVVLELLEDQQIDEHLIAALRTLRARGFTIALDDFRYRPELAELVHLAHYVKLDVMELGHEELARQVAHFSGTPVTLVAEKVETQEDYALCRELGFKLFQGYFFCKPEVVSERGVAPNRLALVQLIAALQDPAVELAELERLIARDVALSYRLLRYINSAFFGLRREVASLGRALALLGLQNVRRWATMTIFASVDDKPRELITTALVRARFCELAGPSFGESNPDGLFTLGLFSVIDALTDSRMDEVLSTIPFPAEMVEALVNRGGGKGALLDCVTALESGQFEVAAVPAVSEAYTDALAWGTEASQELFGEPAPALA